MKQPAVPATFTHPLAGPVYTVPPKPESCSTCQRKGAFMRAFMADNIECSHVECPHRNRVTAQPAK